MKQQDNSTLKILHDIANLGKTTVSELSEIYGLNRSQVRYRLDRINDYLSECGLMNLIIEEENITAPFHWDEISEPLMKINRGDFLLDSLNSDLRRSAECIFIFLSENDVFLKDIISVFKIGKNTALADIKRLKEEAHENDLDIVFSREKGYRFYGDSVILNNLIMSKVDMMNSTDLFISLSYEIFKKDLAVYPQQIYKIIAARLEESGQPYIKEFLGRGSCILSLLYVKDENSDIEVDDIDKKVKTNPAYIMAGKIIAELKKDFGLAVSASTEHYLALLLTYICEDTDILYDKNSTKFAEYLNMSEEIIGRLELITNVESGNKQDHVYRLAKQLDFISFCKKYDFPVVYPYLLNRKRKFDDIYSVIRMIVQSLTNTTFSEDAIALVAEPCMDYLGLNEKNADLFENRSVQIGAGERNTDDCLAVLDDLFISKNELFVKNLVNNLGPQQKKQLYEILSLPELKNVLKPENIAFAQRINDFEEAIRTAAMPLLKQDIITETFIEEILNVSPQRMRRFVVFNGIIMPHASTKKAKKIGFSFLSLHDPVGIPGSDDVKVKIIIMISAVDNRLHSKALAQLADILTDSSERQKLLDAENKEEIIKILYDRKEGQNVRNK